MKKVSQQGKSTTPRKIDAPSVKEIATRESHSLSMETRRNKSGQLTTKKMRTLRGTKTPWTGQINLAILTTTARNHGSTP